MKKKSKNNILKKYTGAAAAPGPVQPRLICIGGLPGTGKTTVGLALLPHLTPGAVLVCPDRTMLRLLGRPEHGTIESQDITPALLAAAIADMKTRTRKALAAGHDTVVPSAFVGRVMRDDFAAIAAATGAVFYPFWLDAPIPVLHDRARRRAFNRAAGNASAVGVDKIRVDAIEGPVNWPRIDAHQSPASVLNAILEKLKPQPGPHTQVPTPQRP